jgi:hypothetical protein
MATSTNSAIKTVTKKTIQAQDGYSIFVKDTRFAAENANKTKKKRKANDKGKIKRSRNSRFIFQNYYI